MNRNQLAIVIGVAGLGAAWYWSRQQGAKLNAILAALPSNPAPLASRQIGDGYLDAITGGSGHAPIQINGDGDMVTPFGTDLLLPALDANDPAIGYLAPGQSPQNTDLIAAALAEGDY